MDTDEISHSGGVRPARTMRLSGFPHAVAVPAALLDVDDAYKRV